MHALHVAPDRLGAAAWSRRSRRRFAPAYRLRSSETLHVAAEAGGDLDDHADLSRPHAPVEFLVAGDRRPLGEVAARAGDVDRVVAADGGLVAVQHGVVQVLHVQGDAVTHDDHQDHTAQAGHRQADRVAGQFEELAVADGQQPLEAEPGAQRAWAGVGLRGRARLDRHGLCRRRRRLGGPALCLRLFQVADEGVLQRRRVPPLDHPVRRVDDQHLSGAHQRDAVAAPGLVDEVGGDEDGHLVAAGQVDQVLPEPVPGHRVHA